MSVLGELLVQINGDNSGLNKTLSKSSQSVSDTVNAMVSKIGGVALAWQAVGLAVDGIKYNAAKEQAEIAFGVFLGGAQKARDMIKDLQKVAIETPLEFADVRDAGKQLLAYGVAAENLVPTIKMLTDVSAGLNIPIKDLSYLYGTIKTQGRAMTVDINQFANRGIPIWEELAKVTGKNGTELRAFVEAGNVGFPIIQAAFRDMTSEGGKFFQMAVKQMDSFTGAQSNLSDATGIYLSNLTAGMMGPLKEGMISITKSMNDATVSATAFGGAFGKTFELAGKVIEPVFAIITQMPGEVTAIGIAAGAAFLAFGPWGAAIAGAAVGLGSMVKLLDDANKADIGTLREHFLSIAESSKMSADQTSKFLATAGSVELTLASLPKDFALTSGYIENIAKNSGLSAVQIANIAINSDRTSKSQKETAEQFLKQNGLLAIGTASSDSIAKNQAIQLANAKDMDAYYAKIYPEQAAAAAKAKAAAEKQAELEKAAAEAAAAKAKADKKFWEDHFAFNEHNKSDQAMEASMRKDQVSDEEWLKNLQEIRAKQQAETAASENHAIVANMIAENDKNQAEKEWTDKLMAIREKQHEAEKKREAEAKVFWDAMASVGETTKKSFEDVLSQGLLLSVQTVTDALSGQKVQWGSVGITAEKALSGILSGLAQQLAAQAASALLMGNFVGAALAAAGAIAAETAAVLLENDAEDKEAAAKKAATKAAKAKTDAKKKEKDATEAATKAAKDAADQAKADADALTSMIKKYDDATKTKLELINQERDAELDKATKLKASEAQLAEIRDFYSKQYQDQVAADAKVITDSYDKIGATFSQAIINGFEQGDSEDAIKKAMFGKLKNMAIESALAASGFSEQFRDIGKMISDALVDGFSSDELTAIKEKINSVYANAATAMTAINSLFMNPDTTSVPANITPLNPPAFADGTNNAPGGWSWVGERGPELMNVPRGSQIIPAAQSRQLLQQNQTTNNNSKRDTTINIQSNAPLDPLQTARAVQQTMESLAFAGVA